MKLTGNTILITGGGSGIGLALGEAFHKAGNQVIAAGRSPEKLKHARAQGLETLSVDLTSAPGIRDFANQAVEKFPKLNVVIHNAGIMKNEKLTKPDAGDVATETVATNLLAPMRLTQALLPHLLRQPAATIITVTSGLAYVPLAMTPTYCATKAAIHSYTLSLRHQLRGTSVEVKELIPPYVRTGLMGERQAQDPNAMPLEEFISEVLAILRDQPSADEIAVGRVGPQRTAGYSGPGPFREFFEMQNERVMAARKAEWEAL